MMSSNNPYLKWAQDFITAIKSVPRTEFSANQLTDCFHYRMNGFMLHAEPVTENTASLNIDWMSSSFLATVNTLAHYRSQNTMCRFAILNFALVPSANDPELGERQWAPGTMSGCQACKDWWRHQNLQQPNQNIESNLCNESGNLNSGWYFKNFNSRNSRSVAWEAEVRKNPQATLEPRFASRFGWDFDWNSVVKVMHFG
ncbi:hypothetical protein F5B20DRAFT_595696 [Whalleya microplaca]|nr:hypothetical protein F5B20DRAFT_595696 [Whalleya microplaca]